MNKGAGLAMFFAVAVAAMRLTPSLQSPAPTNTAKSPAVIEKESPAVQPAVDAKKGPAQYVGGCVAYDADPNDKTPLPYPKQQEFAAANDVLDRFVHPTSPATAESQLSSSQINYAIALVPDPVHTHLSVMFDRQMTDIQQAAQDEDYTYDSSWLPWTQDSSAYPHLSDQQLSSDLSDRREACPGILLFHKGLDSSKPYENALVVFVVGEQPTGGINANQWENAIRWLAANSPVHHPLRILGPTFSGSLVSLQRDLEDLSKHRSDHFQGAQVLSGTITSCAVINWFRKYSPKTTFGTFQENDELQIYRFFRYLASQHTAARDTTILSEDETAYGYSSSSTSVTRSPTLVTGNKAPANDSSSDAAIPPCDVTYNPDNRPVRLFYPRDMSALRLEYQKEGVFDSPAPTGAHQNHPILQNGAEPDDKDSNYTDTIPAFSHSVTPLAQEAILYAIVGNLRAHHTRYLLLRCSNPLDFLFLTRFFHRAYPEARIVIVGQDLLFSREIDSTEFRGVMSISNYPLLPHDQHWTTLFDPTQDSTHSHIVFQSHLDQGAYIAARYTFNTNTLAEPICGATLHLARMNLLPGYTNPYWLSTRDTDPANLAEVPPTWLSVVGRDGFWPLAVLDKDTTPKQIVDPNDPDPGLPAGGPASTMVQLTNNNYNYDFDSSSKQYGPTMLFSLPFAWDVIALCAIFLVLYQIYGFSPLAGRPSSGIFSVIRYSPDRSQQLLLGISCFIALCLLVEVASVSLSLPSSDLLAGAGKYWEEMVCEVAPDVASIFLLILLIKRALQRPFRIALFSFIAGLVALGIAALSFQHALSSNLAANVPLFYRMGHITSGVSPLLPILLLSAGFYLWIWQALAGNALLCTGRPLLPHCDYVPTRGWFNAVCRAIDLQLGFYPYRKTQPTHTVPERLFRISHPMEQHLLGLARPLAPSLIVIVPPALLAASSMALFFHNAPLLAMEGYYFKRVINVLLLVGFLFTLAEAGRLFWTWTELRKLLSSLTRLRLRRTLSRLRAVPATSLWGMSGNVQRVQYQFFAAQWDAANRLQRLNDRLLFKPTLTALKDAVDYGRAFACDNASHLKSAPRWNRPIAKPLEKKKRFTREVLADAVAEVITEVLIPAWREEQSSLSLETESAPADQQDRNLPEMNLSKDESVKAAEEFVCFHYIAFIQNMLARMRTMVISMACLFVSMCFAISFYPFVPRTQVSLWLLLNLALISFTVIFVYAAMERDETISYISNTKPGQLSADFWLKTAGFLAGPVIGILTTQFPGIADSVLGWLQPGLDTIK